VWTDFCFKPNFNIHSDEEIKKFCLSVLNQIELYIMVRGMKLVYKTVEEAPLLTKNRYREIKCIKMYQQLDVCCY
jgi:hypothetical protein